jgi:tetratricopeptide (TPR) repeat protein
MTRASRWWVVILLTTPILAPTAISALPEAKDSSSPSRHGQVDLLEIPKPELGRVDAPVQNQIRAAEGALAAILDDPRIPGAQEAQAFGNLGQTYQAYGFDDAAAACYANAAKLAPGSFRWHYYLAYVHQTSGDASSALRDYRQALALKPNDGCTMLRLGNVELELNHFDSARSWLANPAAQRLAPAAAMAGLGKIALAEKQYRTALTYFSTALSREPQASSIHYQLAMTYRALGDLQQMQEHLQARGEGEPAIKDPLLDEIDAIKQGRVGLLERGSKALHENRFADAIAIYRQLVGLNPSDPIGYIYLAATLAESGQQKEAIEQYRHALQLDPHNATVHFNMGVLFTEAGDEDAAIGHFQEAIRADPDLIAAHFQIANLFMRRGKNGEAEREYGVVVSMEPQNGFARLMQAMAAVHANAYARARSLLEDASLALPRDTDIGNALARILAAAPDPAVRDATRALEIIEALVRSEPSPDFEKQVTLQMALAGVGRFAEAASGQRAMILELERTGRPDVARLLRQNLVRYQHDEPCRTPWASNDPIFTPVPAKVRRPTQTRTMTARP